MDGYSLSGRTGREKGRIYCLAYLEMCTCSEVQNKIRTGPVESLWAKIKRGKTARDVTVNIYYRAPN